MGNTFGPEAWRVGRILPSWPPEFFGTVLSDCLSVSDIVSFGLISSTPKNSGMRAELQKVGRPGPRYALTLNDPAKIIRKLHEVAENFDPEICNLFVSFLSY